MNKAILKIELIAEWIFLIIWLTINLFTLVFAVMAGLENLPEQFSTSIRIIYSITSILYTLILINIIVNIIKTQAYNTDINKNADVIPKYKIVLFILSTIFTLFYIVVIFPIITGFTFFAISYDKTLDDESIFFLYKYVSIAFGGAFTLINTLPALRELFTKKKLSILNIICLVCSALIMLCFITLIMLNLLHKL
ncbi:MAG: hypothetical protein NC390_08175 [Fusobacterium sp.]|nr:hypothetical protein [Fusobacterium sp.]